MSSLSRTIRTGATPNPVGAVRFNPGDYFAKDAYNPSIATIQAMINAAPSVVKGIQVGITWAQMESSQGNYSTGFAYVDQILPLCATREASTGKPFKLMLYINSDTAGVSPSYIQAAGFDGGLGTYVPPAPSQRVPCFWRTSIQNALIARDIAYLDKYDADPNFEMLAGPKGETDTTYDVTGGPGYSDTNYLNCFKNWATQCLPHAPHAQLRIIANFMPGGWSAMEALIQHCKATRIAMGGPDGYTRFITVAIPYPTDFTMVLHGYTKKTGSWALDGTDYSAQGVLCLIHDMQTPEMGGKENQAAFPSADDLRKQGAKNGDMYLVWWLHQQCWAPPYNANKQLYGDNTTANTTSNDGVNGETNGHYTPDIKTYLPTTTVALNTSVPSYYGAVASAGFMADATAIATGGPFYYDNIIQTDLNYASEAAALAAGIISSFYNASGGPTTEHAFVPDPAGSGKNVWRIRVRSSEDGWLASMPVPSCSYCYFSWEEYYDPAWNTAYLGKMNRMDGASIDHIMTGGAGVANRLSLLMQGADSGENIDAGSTPMLPRGQWVKLAHEEFLDSVNGYARLSIDDGSGWRHIFLSYNFNGAYSSNRSQFTASSSGGVGAVPFPGRKFTSCQIGGWYSGAPTDTVGSTNYRHFRNVKILYNPSTAPHT